MNSESSLKNTPDNDAAIQALVRYGGRELSRRDLWEFCKWLAPDFYKDDRPHLKKICDTLQALYERRVAKKDINDPKEDWIVFESADLIPPGWFICTKLMINIPPQHGKTRTLIMFAAWVFGKNLNEKIITCSYNDGTAHDFSKYTRDLIAGEKNMDDDEVYSDVFPDTKIKYGTASYKKWALEGRHFNYLGAGIGGAVTSKGGTMLIVDDPIKGAEEALNNDHLEKVWLWYVGTFRSRVSADKGEPLEIINMTRWSVYDPCGKMLEEKEALKWMILKMEVYDEKTDTMLCGSLFSKNRYDDQKQLAQSDKILEQIFMANYHQEPFEAKGLLFNKRDMNYYRPSPILDKMFESSLAYADVADDGDDSFAMPIGKNIGPRIYITEVMFTKADTGITLDLCAEVMKKNGVQKARIESNSMGSTFRKFLQKKTKGIQLYGLTNTTNKHTRIIMRAWAITRYCYFLHPDYWTQEYEAFMKELFKYKKEVADEKHDDAPDAMSGLIQFVMSTLRHMYDKELE